MTRTIKRLLAILFIASFTFAVTYLKYLSDAVPNVRYESMQARVIVETYESYTDWLLERPTIEIRTLDLPKPEYDPSELSPFERQHLKPMVNKPDIE